MALFPDYVTAAELKTHLRITDTDDDAELAIAIAAASRAIDKATNRQFGLSAAPEARTYRRDGRCIDGRIAVQVFDVQTTVGLVVKLDQGQDGVYEQTLTLGTDFDMWPWNAAGDGIPWTHIVFRPSASFLPVGYPNELQVTASWGWTSVPTIVKQATLITAARFFVRRDSQYGIAGSPETGTEMRLLERLDPDVTVMLGAVRRWWGAVS